VTKRTGTLALILIGAALGVAIPIRQLAVNGGASFWLYAVALLLGLVPGTCAGLAFAREERDVAPGRLASGPPSPRPARVERRDLLGGLVHEYRAAA